MHGLIFFQFESFISKNLGIQKWFKLLELCDIEKKVYSPTQVYPDGELTLLVSKTAQLTSKSTESVLEEFGEFIVPSMLKIYAGSIKPEWNFFDILENTESTMHKAVRFADKRADPPKLVCDRVSQNKVVIKYSSHRKMVDFGVGIIKGLAKAKLESIKINRSDSLNITYIEVTRKVSVL